MILKLRYLLILPLVFFFNIKIIAQTTLSPGDIAVIHIRSDTPDRFAFITFVDIDSGTGIYFSDCGADANGFNMPCTEGVQKYTVPPGGLNAGSIIQYEQSTTNANFSGYTDSRISGFVALSGNGDQITVFQDATNLEGGSNAANTPTFIFITHNSSTLFTGDKNDTNQSSLPTGLSDLTTPRSALALGVNSAPEDEIDNVIYNGTYDFSGFATKNLALAAAKNAFTNPANYYSSNSSDTTYETARAAIPSELNIMTLSNHEFSNNSFSIYPNPSNGNITIKNSGISLQHIIITDLNGRVLFSNKTNKIAAHINLKLKLIPGIYLIKLTSNRNSITKKIIIK